MVKTAGRSTTISGPAVAAFSALMIAAAVSAPSSLSAGKEDLAAGRASYPQSVAGNKDAPHPWEVADPYYPKYHVSPPYGWMNDPHPVYFKGAYHLFYQFSYARDNPYPRPPGKSPLRTWGHALSTDLVHWKRMPIALYPAIHGTVDIPEIYSGCLVDNRGVGTAFYTINNIDIWSSSSPDDDLATFVKNPGNPVVKGPPPGLPITGGMRDPWVWREGENWYMIVGSGLEGGRGPVIPLYQSSDLKHWRYLHPLYQGEGSRFDLLGDAGFCECPSFFPLGGKYVLVVSDKTTYFVGRYEHERFIPERRGRLDYGKGPTAKDGGIYAPQFVLDGKGRRIMWGWVGGWEKMRRERQANIEAGWAGSQTLPRALSLNSDGLLDFEPADEIASLRANHRSFDGISLPAGDSVLLEGFQGLQLELHAVIDAGTANAVGVELLDGRGKARLFYDVQTGSLGFNQTSVPMDLKRREPLDLRVFVDSTILEVYANKRIVLTENLQPLSSKGYRIRLFAEGGEGRALKADGWNMGTVW